LAWADFDLSLESQNRFSGPTNLQPSGYSSLLPHENYEGVLKLTNLYHRKQTLDNERSYIKRRPLCLYILLGWT